MKLGDDHTADETRPRIQLIQPRAPEPRDLRGGDRDAAEEGEGDDDEGVQQHGDEGGGREGADHLAEGDGEELGDEDHEELVAGAGGGGLQAGDVVEGEEEADGAEETVGHLCHHQAQREG